MLPGMGVGKLLLLWAFLPVGLLLGWVSRGTTRRIESRREIEAPSPAPAAWWGLAVAGGCCSASGMWW